MTREPTPLLPQHAPLWRRLVAEFLGTGLLVAVVVGSGIAAHRLSPTDVGLQLLENSLTTALGLTVLILAFGSVSGAHFNPVVSAADWFIGRRDRTGLTLPDLAAYIAAQVAGAIGGSVLANLMFEVPTKIATTHRDGAGRFLGEVVATAGLLILIFALARTHRAALAAPAVGAYIGAAYWFTSSTSFANPAVTIGRIFSDTFAGIAPASVPAFTSAQLIGAVVGVVIILVLFPTVGRSAGDVKPWQSLAHRNSADLEATGMNLRLDTLATRIDVADRNLEVRDTAGTTSLIGYDELIVGTGAVPSTAGIAGLDQLGPDDGVHVLHSMGDTFTLDRHLDERTPRTAIIIGAGYVGLEMAEGLSVRGIHVTQLQRGPEVLSTLDPELGALIHTELTRHGVEVVTDSKVASVTRGLDGLTVAGTHLGQPFERTADLVLAVVGVVPNTSLLVDAGARLGAGNAVVVDESMRTGLPNVWAAGDGIITHHRLLGLTYLPLGTTSHKQGRIAGENALGGSTRFAGSIGTQAVKVFDLVAARTGLREHEAVAAGFDPISATAAADDHKAYFPGSHPITIRITGDRSDHRLLGAQMVGSYGTEVSKRIDTYATAIHHGMTVEAISELDLSYTPPLGSPWDAIQIATQAWSRSITF